MYESSLALAINAYKIKTISYFHSKNRFLLDLNNYL